MREASVLHAAAIEVFIGLCLEHQGRTVLVKADGLRLATGLSVQFVGQRHESGLAIEAQGQFMRADHHFSARVLQFNGARGATRRIYQNLCRRCSLRIANNASVVVAEEAENIFTVKVDRQVLTIGIGNFDGRGIDFFGFNDSLVCLFGLAALAGVLRIAGSLSRKRRKCYSWRLPEAGRSSALHNGGNGWLDAFSLWLILKLSKLIAVY